MSWCSGHCRILGLEASYGSLTLHLIVIRSSAAFFRGLDIAVLVFETARTFLGGQYFLDK